MWTSDGGTGHIPRGKALAGRQRPRSWLPRHAVEQLRELFLRNENAAGTALGEASYLDSLGANQSAQCAPAQPDCRACFSESANVRELGDEVVDPGVGTGCRFDSHADIARQSTPHAPERAGGELFRARLCPCFRLLLGRQLGEFTCLSLIRNDTNWCHVGGDVGTGNQPVRVGLAHTPALTTVRLERPELFGVQLRVPDASESTAYVHEDPRKNTQQRIADRFGVAQQTVSDWFRDANTEAGKGVIPDARSKHPPEVCSEAARRTVQIRSREDHRAPRKRTGGALPKLTEGAFVGSVSARRRRFGERAGRHRTRTRESGTGKTDRRSPPEQRPPAPFRGPAWLSLRNMINGPR